ncbi:MAG: hypothetical protein WCT77_00090 [Bacteroidota bacterium]
MKKLTKFIRDKRTVLFSLILIGFFIRFAGIFFNGNHNFDTYREWGINTLNKGLADSFVGGYGPIAYLMMLISEKFAVLIPHLWWLPYKATNLIFEILILLLLYKLIPKNKIQITLVYWLNPWFFIPGSWEGFWDAPFMFFILLALGVLDFRKNLKHRFFYAGLMMGIAFCIKPQIVAPLVAMGLYFIFFQLISFRFREITSFTVGFGILPFLFNTYFFLQAKSAFYLFQLYFGFTSYMPYLVASEINIWYTVTSVIMNLNHMKGPIYSLSTYTFPYNYLEKSAYLVFFLIMAIFIIKSYIAKSSNRPLFFTRAFTLPFIMMPQILTRSHAYHFYPATLLLILIFIIGKDRKLFILWIISAFIHFCNIYSGYGLGRSIINNPFPLIFWQEPIISIMGIVQFLLALGLIYSLLFPKNITQLPK